MLLVPKIILSISQSFLGTVQLLPRCCSAHQKPQRLQLSLNRLILNMPCPELSFFAALPQTLSLVTRRRCLFIYLCKHCFLAAVGRRGLLFAPMPKTLGLITRRRCLLFAVMPQRLVLISRRRSPYLLLWRRCLPCSVPS